MISIAFDVLVVAALMGAGLALHYMRGPAARQLPAALPLLHGGLGVVGLALLLAVLRRGLPSTDNGTSGFGGLAAGFFAAALVVGLVIVWTGWRGRRPRGLAVATHACLAITGLVVLITLVALS